MGCDIHMYAEMRISEDNKYWYKVGAIFKNEYYDKDSAPTEYNSPLTDRPYKGRNYDLFAVLAGVRNGVGFAGCDTGDPIVPLSEPRGLPQDVDSHIAEESDEWGCDGHSHSYFTLQELMDYDWVGNKKTHRGWVTGAGYKHYIDNGHPDGWCGGVVGGLVEHISHQEMEKRIKEGQLTEHEYTQVEWESSMADECSHFLETTIPALKEIAEPDMIRVVFWFDN